MVSGVKCQDSETPELTPRMRLRLSETVKRLNVEHRTSNIEHRILMTLRFIDFKTSESRGRRDLKTVKFQRVDSLLAFVANLEKSACSVFF